MAIELPFATVEMVGAFLLVFLRMTGMVVAAPLFSNPAFPRQLRVWFAFMLGLVLFPVAWQSAPAGAVLAILQHPLTSILAVGGELAIGWVLGWTASILIWAVQLTGHLVGQELGLSLGDIFDPISESQAGIMPQIYLSLALLAFVLVGGHHMVVLCLGGSFAAAPLGSFPLSAATGEYLAGDVNSTLWREGLRLALPVMVALLLVTVAMAVMARAVPEMNIFVIGFTLRIVFGLLAVVVTLPFVGDAMHGLLAISQGMLDSIFVLWTRD